jgi:hypothetical protein
MEARAAALVKHVMSSLELESELAMKTPNWREQVSNSSGWNMVKERNNKWGLVANLTSSDVNGGAQLTLTLLGNSFFIGFLHSYENMGVLRVKVDIPHVHRGLPAVLLLNGCTPCSDDPFSCCIDALTTDGSRVSEFKGVEISVKASDPFDKGNNVTSICVEQKKVTLSLVPLQNGTEKARGPNKFKLLSVSTFCNDWV